MRKRRPGRKQPPDLPDVLVDGRSTVDPVRLENDVGPAPARAVTNLYGERPDGRTNCTMRMKRARRISLRLLAVLTGLSLGLFALDRLVGWMDPMGTVTAKRDGARYQKQLVELDPKSPRVFRHRPNAEVDFDLAHVRTDSCGLRGPERARPKPAGVKRLLFLGDSITFALGVGEPDTFVERTARTLTEFTDDRWEAINAGHLMYDTRQELATLEEVGFDYEPDIVALVYTNNDVVSTRKTYEKVRESREITPEARDFLAASRRLGLIRPYLPNLFSLLHSWLKLAKPGGQMGSLEGAQAIGLSLEDGWQGSRDALLAIRARCAEHGIPFVVFTFERTGWAAPRVEELCRTEGIPFASIGFLDEEYHRGLHISQADPHPNARGHAILARNILAYLRRSGMIVGLRE